MTQEEKQLLLIDLCARIPYGVKIEYCFDEGCGTYRKEVGVLNGFYPKKTSIDGVDFILEITTQTGYVYHLHYESWTIKPYLRSMSSMTEEEKEERKEYTLVCGGWTNDGFDWLNAHSF